MGLCGLLPVERLPRPVPRGPNAQQSRVALLLGLYPLPNPLERRPSGNDGGGSPRRLRLLLPLRTVGVRVWMYVRVDGCGCVRMRVCVCVCARAGVLVQLVRGWSQISSDTGCAPCNRFDWLL